MDDDEFTIEATVQTGGSGGSSAPGDLVYLGDALGKMQMYGIVGPPGPAGPPAEASITFEGTRPVSREWHYRMTFDGWEYTFPSKEVARKVREELLRMTLEGEL